MTRGFIPFGIILSLELMHHTMFQMKMKTTFGDMMGCLSSSKIRGKHLLSCGLYFFLFLNRTLKSMNMTGIFIGLF